MNDWIVIYSLYIEPFTKTTHLNTKYLCIYNWYRFTNLNSVSINCSENIQQLYNYKPHTLLKYSYSLKKLERIILITQWRNLWSIKYNYSSISNKTQTIYRPLHTIKHICSYPVQINANCHQRTKLPNKFQKKFTQKRIRFDTYQVVFAQWELLYFNTHDFDLYEIDLDLLQLHLLSQL